MDDTLYTPACAPSRKDEPTDVPDALTLTRAQARRLRDIHRSAGWPTLDPMEIELLASGLIHRVGEAWTSERLRLTDAGIRTLARALQRNRQALNTHDALVAKVAQCLMRDGRLVWTGLSVRARLLQAPEAAVAIPDADAVTDSASVQGPTPDFVLGACSQAPPSARWKMCKPDVFSIRNSSVASYLQPVVHEIKVSRADLLGDLRLPHKRECYLDLGSQCWYVLGCDARGRAIAQADEVPTACGVIVAQPDGQLVVLRQAPQRAMANLPFALWMALAKSAPLYTPQGEGVDGEPDQALLGVPSPTGP